MRFSPRATVAAAIVAGVGISAVVAGLPALGKDNPNGNVGNKSHVNDHSHVQQPPVGDHSHTKGPIH